MPNELMLIKEKLIPNLKQFLPKYKDGENRVATSLINAWAESICLDYRTGILYVKADKLHTILRLYSKADGQYFVDSIEKEAKIMIDHVVYVATYAVIEKLNERMIGAELKKRDYLKYSEDLLIAVREAPVIIMEQEKIRQLELENIKKLKAERIKYFKIKKDELTNEVLIKRTAEFSHIRRKSEYYRYADCMQNGLIVNKETHELITKEAIHDEEELLDLCRTQGWNEAWYKDFKRWLGGTSV